MWRKARGFGPSTTIAQAGEAEDMEVLASLQSGLWNLVLASTLLKGPFVCTTH